MDWYDNVLKLINLRSFSSVWYWIALAVFWSIVTYRIMGIPFDMITRAAKCEQASDELDKLARVMAQRQHLIAADVGPWVIAIWFFILTSLGILGFAYGFEMAQAMFMIAVPMAMVGFIGLQTARKTLQSNAQGAELRRILWKHRVIVQGIGMVAIFISAMWGMYYNLNADHPTGLGKLGAIEKQE